MVNTLFIFDTYLRVAARRGLRAGYAFLSGLLRTVQAHRITVYILRQ